MAKVDLEAIKPNSHTYKDQISKLERSSLDKESGSKEKVKLQPVVNKVQVVEQKKHPIRDFIGGFIRKDSDDIKDFLLNDVLIPGFLDMLSLCLTGDTGRHGRGSRRSRRSEERESYSAYYDGRRTRKRRDYEEDNYPRRKNKLDYQNIIIEEDENSKYFSAKDAALEIVDKLHDRIEKDGYATIADLFDLVNWPSDFTDNRWGWRIKDSIGVRRVPDGWLIDVDNVVYVGDD